MNWNRNTRKYGRLAVVTRPTGNNLGAFDRFATAANTVVSRAPFFCACVLLVGIWFPTLFIFAVNTSQLIINTITTIITFLLVALLQNSQTRSDEAIQQKLNAIADGLADLMDAQSRRDTKGLAHDVKDLRSTVGLEDRESA
jgi:low affinity Fe/Cu permease